jgi:hypothetical protein
MSRQTRLAKLKANAYIKKWSNILNISNSDSLSDSSSVDSENFIRKKNHKLQRSKSLQEISFEEQILKRSNSLNCIFQEFHCKMNAIYRELKYFDKFDGKPSNVDKFLKNIDRLNGLAIRENLTFADILPYILNKIDGPLYSSIANSAIVTLVAFKEAIFRNLGITESSDAIFSKIFSLKQINFPTFESLINEMDSLYHKYVSAVAFENLKKQYKSSY